MISTTSIKQALSVEVALNDDMVAALRLWTQMYENKSPWLKNKEIYSLNLASAVASEIARICTIEMEVKIDGSSRASYLAEQFEKVMDKMRDLVEYGSAKGGIVFKPYVKEENINVDFIQADQFFPIKFDANGNIQSCVFVDQRKKGDKNYTRLEFHEMLENKGYKVTNKAYRSSSKDVLGTQIALTEVEDWVSLSPETTLKGIERPLFAYFRFPVANNIDPSSPLGVSCYSRAVELIEQADRQWSNLMWEFESGQRALYVDVLAFGKDADKKPLLPNKRLYRALHQGGTVGDEEMFHEWTPTLREQNILKGLDAILKKIEFSCGIAYGTLSDPQMVDKTATEIKTSKQRTYSTVVDTQKALHQALDDLLYVMDVWATLNKLAGKGKFTATYEFDDSVIVDKDAQFEQDLRLVNSGIMGNVEFRMRNLGEDEQTAIKMVQAATDERKQEQDLFAEESGGI